MSNPVHIVLLLAIVAWWLAAAILADRIADRKGRIGGVYLFAGLVIGPIALLIAALLPRRQVPPEGVRRSRR
jgi:hypothetical protein